MDSNNLVKILKISLVIDHEFMIYGVGIKVKYIWTLRFFSLNDISS